MMQAYRPTSHDGLVHDLVDSFGFDWEKIGDPNIAPRHPRKLYVPRTTADVVATLREVAALGEKVVVRSKGHSSNDLVLREGGVVIYMGGMNRILSIDEAAGLAVVQGGAVSAVLEEELMKRGFGLPVIGDHDDITVGGFASVGGIGPASHRYGMFVDNVTAFEMVTWAGEVLRCSREQNRELFYRTLVGLGRQGIITEMTLRFIRIDKLGTILHNDRSLFTDFSAFVALSGQKMSAPGDTQMIRGAFIDMIGTKTRLRRGQFSAYMAAPPSALARLRNHLSYRYLHTIGYWAGRLPTTLDNLLKKVSIGGILFPPRYASIKNVERFTDKLVDSTVGDPSRWYILLTPMAAYAQTMAGLAEIAEDIQKKHQCFPFVSYYVKALRSEFLSPEDPSRLFCELNFFTGVDPKRFTPAVLAELVERIDTLCVKVGSFRYMHTRTVKDPERLKRLDPNARFADTQDPAWAGRLDPQR